LDLRNRVLNGCSFLFPGSTCLRRQRKTCLPRARETRCYPDSSAFNEILSVQLFWLLRNVDPANAFSPRLSPVATMQCATLRNAVLFSELSTWLANESSKSVALNEAVVLFRKLFPRCAGSSWRLCLVAAAEVSLRPFALWTAQSLLLVCWSALHVFLREYVPFPRGQIPRPGWRALFLVLYLFVLFRAFLFLAYESFPLHRRTASHGRNLKSF
jgi:hypothetical protein